MDELLILALESSAKAASCALCRGEKLLARAFRNNGLTHSTTLLPMAEELLAACSLKAADLDLIAVAKGPGSFTGIRIGVAAAKGLAWGADKPGLGVSTLEALAWNAAALEGALLCPCMDARRGQVYNALFRVEGGLPVRLCEDRAISLQELIDDLRGRGEAPFLMGDGAELAFRALKEAGLDCRLAPENLRWQDAYGVAAAALHAPEESWGDLEPVYLRLSQAERERLEREKRS